MKMNFLRRLALLCAVLTCGMLLACPPLMFAAVPPSTNCIALPVSAPAANAVCETVENHQRGGEQHSGKPSPVFYLCASSDRLHIKSVAQEGSAPGGSPPGADPSCPTIFITEAI